jgi:hypothetical protein
MAGLTAAAVLIFLAIEEQVERKARRTWRCIRGGRR